MKTIGLIILAIYLLLTNYVSGQTSDANNTVVMTPYTLDEKVCILFQNDSFLIITSTKVLKNLYGQSTSSASSLNDERKLFIECNNNSDTVDFYSCAKQKLRDYLVINRAAELIEKSICVVLNKKTNKIVITLIIKPYEDVGVGGTAYYADGQLVFETIDRIY